MRALFSIDYDEAPDTYRAVTVKPQGRDGEIARFGTGDPVADMHDAMVYAAGRFDGLMFSSSMDHFVHDQPGYRYDENDLLVADIRELSAKLLGRETD